MFWLAGDGSEPSGLRELAIHVGAGAAASAIRAPAMDVKRCGSAWTGRINDACHFPSQGIKCHILHWRWGWFRPSQKPPAMRKIIGERRYLIESHSTSQRSTHLKGLCCPYSGKGRTHFGRILAASPRLDAAFRVCRRRHLFFCRDTSRVSFFPWPFWPLAS